MANRSYLYSTDNLPESEEWQIKRVLHGISEYRYDIPLVFKILLTGNPTPHRSSIWNSPEKIAISGDYQVGIGNLSRYLERLDAPEARPLVVEARRFLNDPKNVRRYFVLECGEIFDLTEGPLESKNSALVDEIKAISASLDVLDVPQPTTRSGASAPGFFSKLFGHATPVRTKTSDPLEPFYKIGLGGWSDILYFDFSENEA